MSLKPQDTLLDPEWALPAAKRRAKNSGLLLAYARRGPTRLAPAAARSAQSLVGETAGAA